MRMSVDLPAQGRKLWETKNIETTVCRQAETVLDSPEEAGVTVAPACVSIYYLN